MSEKQDKIHRAVRTMEAYGYKLPKEIDDQVRDLANPNYRVAVVGKFQVGKSTLLNRVFLGDKPILAEGEGLCTTAVATDITYGDVRKLSAYHVTNDQNQAERLVFSKQNPTKEDLWNATVSSDGHTRGEFAKTVSRIVLEEPNESLKGYTLIDTPGLDDPEKDLLLNTTFRIIPKTDVAIVIVEAKMLDTVITNFLRNELIGKNGISRIMMLVSYRPDLLDLDDDQRKEILDTIKAQLAGIGRENIQVEMYCFDPSVDDIMCNASEIRLMIDSFLDKNALPGREEKVTNLIRAELEKAQVEVAAKIKTSGISAEEKVRLHARIEHEVEEFKSKCEDVFRKLQDEVRGICGEVALDIDLAVDAGFDAVYMELEKSETVSAMKVVLDHVETTLKSDLSQRVSGIGIKVQTKLKAVLEKYTQDFSEIYNGWNQFLSEEFAVERPFITKIPPLVWDVVNVLILDMALPMGWLIALITHILGGKKVNITEWLVKKSILMSARSNLDNAKSDVRQRIKEMIRANIENSFAQVKEAIEGSNKKQVEAIRAAMDAMTDCADEKAKLEAAKVNIESVLAAI